MVIASSSFRSAAPSDLTSVSGLEAPSHLIASNRPLSAVPKSPCASAKGRDAASVKSERIIVRTCSAGALRPGRSLILLRVPPTRRLRLILAPSSRAVRFSGSSLAIVFLPPGTDPVGSLSTCRKVPLMSLWSYIRANVSREINACLSSIECPRPKPLPAAGKKGGPRQNGLGPSHGSGK